MNLKLKWQLMVILGVIVLTPVFANAGKRYKVIQLKNGSKAIQYLPKKYKYYRRYPLLIALHGMKQTKEDAFKKWQEIADHFGMVLLCPQGSDFEKGYTRKPIDDRRNIVQFRNLVTQHYKIDGDRSYVVGFSRGGTMAIELGIMHPYKFKHIVSFFGYFNRSLEVAVRHIGSRNAYKNSSFLIITGKSDLSETASKRGYHVFHSLDIKTKLVVFDHIQHQYPPKIKPFFQKFINWTVGKPLGEFSDATVL